MASMLIDDFTPPPGPIDLKALGQYLDKLPPLVVDTSGTPCSERICREIQDEHEKHPTNFVTREELESRNDPVEQEQ